jgi:hypothetical protein
MKSPRHYAADFVAARGNAKSQKAVVDSIPPEWLDLVRTHVKIQKQRNKK